MTEADESRESRVHDRLGYDMCDSVSAERISTKLGVVRLARGKV